MLQMIRKVHPHERMVEQIAAHNLAYHSTRRDTLNANLTTNEKEEDRFQPLKVGFQVSISENLTLLQSAQRRMLKAATLSVIMIATVFCFFEVINAILHRLESGQRQRGFSESKNGILVIIVTKKAPETLPKRWELSDHQA